MAFLEKQLYVKKSTLPNAGKGLFTKKLIPKGTRIVEYKGKTRTWKEVQKDDLHQFLATKLVKWWMPDAIEFVDALPLGATGKVLKRELRQQFADYKLT